MTESLKGVAAILLACTLWGLSGIYFDKIAHVPPLEVLAHRMIWSSVFFLALFALQGRLREFGRTLRRPRNLAVLTGTAILISINWFGYIWAIQNSHATEASLGYYIFPLVAVALGFVVLRERFNMLQLLAVACAVLAVLVMTMGLGTVPWVALMLAATFGTYGLIKKMLEMGPVMSVAIEILILLPLALIWLGSVHMTGQGAFGTDLATALWLMASVLFTGVPLVLFSYASRRLTYATLGVLQYLNPTLQFAVAMVYFGEAFTPVHAIAFPLIWVGVGLYCLNIWRQDRRSRRQARS